MGVLRKVLFGKVDLDTLTLGLVLGINPEAQLLQSIRGSASRADLNDPRVLTMEVGGSGRMDENNFDHHDPAVPSLSACAQALRRLARLVDYVDEVDRGVRVEVGVGANFPSLVQLVSGMLLCVKDPETQMRKGLEVLRAVVQLGIDPYGCMAAITEYMPETQEWIEAKRKHESLFQEACASAQWFTTDAGRKLAVLETTWVGAPGALYGLGAEIVIALNPRHEIAGRIIRKFTVASNRDKGIKVTPVLSVIESLEKSWGGPGHGTIVGSPTDRSSKLSLEAVKDIVIDAL